MVVIPAESPESENASENVVETDELVDTEVPVLPVNKCVCGGEGGRGVCAS